MDPIDPLKAASLHGLANADEVKFQAKKKINEARMETADPAADTSDVSQLTPEAAKLAKPPLEAFLESAKGEILTMDRNSETYLDDATQKLVSTAFEKKYGEKFTQDPGYPQMEAKLKSIILNDPESRGMIEDLIALIHVEAEQRG